MRAMENRKDSESDKTGSITTTTKTQKKIIIALIWWSSHVLGEGRPRFAKLSYILRSTETSTDTLEKQDSTGERRHEK